MVDDGRRTATPEALARFRDVAGIAGTGPEDFVGLDAPQEESRQGRGHSHGTDAVDTELVVIHDADLEYHPHDLPKMVEVFLLEDADAVFGSRFMSGGYKRALFFRHALGNKFLTFLCDLVCDLNLTDMETCYKMVRADLLKSIPLESATFDVEPELAIKLAKRGSPDFRGADQLFGPNVSRRQEDRLERRRSRPLGHPSLRDVGSNLRGGRTRRRNSRAAEPRAAIHALDGGRDSTHTSATGCSKSARERAICLCISCRARSTGLRT